jgi:hypothetical protein
MVMRSLVLGLSALAGVGLVGLFCCEPALAMAKPLPRGGPGPLIGLGLPLAGAVVATALIARRFRRRP